MPDALTGCECRLVKCSHQILERNLDDGRCPLLGDWVVPVTDEDVPRYLCHGCASQLATQGGANLDRAHEVRLIEWDIPSGDAPLDE